LDDRVIKSYTRMKSLMLRTFDCNTKSTCEYQIMFLHRKMTENETVHQYYAELIRLAKLGYPSLSEDQLFQQVGELFMRSLTKNHSQLQYKLFEKYNKSKNYKNWKHFMVDVEKFNEMFDNTSINYNARANVNKVSFKCDCLNKFLYNNKQKEEE